MLLLIVVQLVFRLSAPDVDWANFLSILLQAVIVAIVAIAARLPPKAARLVFALTGVVMLVAVATLLDPSTEVGTFLPLTAGLVVLAPAMIVFWSRRRLRSERQITFDLMFGALSIYLLLGYLFSLVFQAIGDLGSGGFFANGAAESPANVLYFSFVTMTTVGYGDLAAADGVGRAFAILLALLGQIYLVTVVAIIVSSLGTRTAAR